mmetsp:Transcript_23063/g.71869  ORF Transcript_23063/g.71869 Transcript_23063/m.71869 type:complete len:169 (+) Transcript_23063:194-700(+)
MPVQLRCSVHRAQVLTGNIGSPSRMKYGALGDGVNLAARLKGLNTRYGTHLLVSSDTLDFLGANDAFVVRPVGRLVLKGRTTPTPTFEVLGKQRKTPTHILAAAEKHARAFDLFLRKHFAEAKLLFEEVHASLSDRLSQHLGSLCDRYLVAPPADGWDGAEHLKQKAW